jgi:phosphoserine phosphatase RsbU/P
MDMEAVGLEPVLPEQLIERQKTLREAASQNGANLDYARLLNEVDSALQRFDEGTYGICETCHDPVEAERLLADPLMTVCLGCLTEPQQRALEDDLQLAAQIQRRLLPESGLKADAWEVDFVYEPAAIVSGDYCDVISLPGESYFILGDVSGKGMAASLLMSNLHAMFHSLVPLGLPLEELMARANRIFCENTLSNHFATLICLKANRNGEVEFCNAGHLPPVILRQGETEVLSSSDLPLGMFCEVSFETHKLALRPGDSLLLYTDGVTETTNHDGDEFGIERLLHSAGNGAGELKNLLQKSGEAVKDFRGNAARADDLTIMALRFAVAAGQSLAA